MEGYSPQEIQTIRLAGVEALEECGNDTYMEARGTIELLMEEVASYKTKVATLTEVIERTFVLRATEARAPEGQGANAEDRSVGLPPLAEYPETLCCEQYRAVKYWRRSDYIRTLRSNKGNTNALATARPKCGRPCRAAEDDSDGEANDIAWDSLDPNKMPKHPYIETEGGKPASHETLWAIGIKARRVWQTLAGKGLAPTRWGLVTDHANEYFTQEMLNTFIEFRLCESNWKLHYWITKSYSSWFQNHFKLKAKKDNVIMNSTMTAPSSASGSLVTNSSITSDANTGFDLTTNSAPSSMPGPTATNSDHTASGSHSDTGSDEARRHLDNPSNENEFVGQESNRESNREGEPDGDERRGEDEEGIQTDSRNNEGEDRGNNQGTSGANNDEGDATGNNQDASDANNPGENGANGESRKRAAQGQADGWPSKRQKKPPALAILGLQNTERNFAMHAWVENNAGGLKKDFDTWYKGPSAEVRKPFANAARASKKGKSKE